MSDCSCWKCIARYEERTSPVKTEWAERMRANPSSGEIVLLDELDRTGLLGDLLFQHVLFGYIVDFFAPIAMLAIEVDGSQHVPGNAADARRDRNLKAHGITTIRFTVADIVEDVEQVARDIWTAFKEHRDLVARVPGFGTHEAWPQIGAR